jgi:hypothetical protein
MGKFKNSNNPNTFIGPTRVLCVNEGEKVHTHTGGMKERHINKTFCYVRRVQSYKILSRNLEYFVEMEKFFEACQIPLRLPLHKW